MIIESTDDQSICHLQYVEHFYMSRKLQSTGEINQVSMEGGEVFQSMKKTKNPPRFLKYMLANYQNGWSISNHLEVDLSDSHYSMELK